MGFKMRIFKGAFIICVFFKLDIIRADDNCAIKDKDGTVLTGIVRAADIQDNTRPSVIATYYTTEDVTGIEFAKVPVHSRYLNISFDDKNLSISLTEDYSNWETIEGPDFDRWLDMGLVYKCSGTTSQKQLSVRVLIAEYNNNYPPDFDKENYKVTLPMPLPAKYLVAGGCTGVPIIITDYDYNELYYHSDVYVTMGDADGLEVSVEKDNNTKTWSVIVQTKAAFSIEKEITVAFTAKDETPNNLLSGILPKAKTATLTIIPNIAESPPTSPLFKQPIYSGIVSNDDKLISLEATLVEGFTNAEVQLLPFDGGQGEDLLKYFRANRNEATVTVTQIGGISQEVLDKNFGIFILEAKVSGAQRNASTVIHITLPGNSASLTTTTCDTTCPTSSETCPPCDSTCPTCDTTCPTSDTTCPPCDTTCPTSDTTCPTCDTTCPTCDTTCPTSDTTCPICDTTCPTSDTSCPTSDTTCPICDTTCPTSSETCPPCDTTCPTSSETCPTCDTTCPTCDTTCPTCDTTCPTSPETSTCLPCDGTTAPPDSKIIKFREEEAYFYVYTGSKGFRKVMKADCNYDCELQYEIKDEGEHNGILDIDSGSGEIIVEESISDSFDFVVIASDVKEEANAQAIVHIVVMTTVYFPRALSVQTIQENTTSNESIASWPTSMEDGCSVGTPQYIPKEAGDYFVEENGDIKLETEIDRENTTLFKDQGNTNILIIFEVICETNNDRTHTIRSGRSLIDDIDYVENNRNKTVIAIKVQDINDNRPQFINNETEVVVGYPDAKIVSQVLPPYLIQVQATDSDEGENAMFSYKLEESTDFIVSPYTGVVYPGDGFSYEDTSFKVYAEDSVGRGDPITVTVKILSSENLVTIAKTGSLLEDIQGVLKDISDITSLNVKSLTANVITSDDGNDSEAKNIKSARDSVSSLQLVVYGLDGDKPVESSVLQKKLEGSESITAGQWVGNSDNSNDGNSDTGMLAGVITLAVILALILVGAGAGFLLYVRRRRNRAASGTRNLIQSEDNDSSETLSVESGVVAPAENITNLPANVQFSDTMQVIEPSPQPSPALPRISLTGDAVEPVAESSDYMTILGDFDEGSSDEFKPETSEKLYEQIESTDDDDDDDDDGGTAAAVVVGAADVDDDEEEEDYTMQRRKSVVTFNDNVERIEIERL